MSNKRKSSSGPDMLSPDLKRSRHSSPESDDEPASVSRPRLDPTYGQRGAFPGLDTAGSDDAMFYGPAADGFEYLRMVRSEAKTVPNLLVAKSSPANQPRDIYSDYPQGYYADGAYTATPAPVANGYNKKPEDDEDGEDPQEAYYTSLCARFVALSSLLEGSPPSNLDSSSASQTAQRLSLCTNPAWRSVLNTTPTTTILGLLPQEAVLHGLRMLESRLAKEQFWKKPVLSLWAWGLLARCRDVGQMVSEDIGILRDLGKRAVWVLRGLRAGLDQLDHGLGRTTDGEETEDDGPEETDATAAPEAHRNDRADILAAAKARMLSSLSAGFPNSGTGLENVKLQDEAADNREQTTRLLVTLDMIITIVGEFYGQRDLLGGRIVWGELDTDNS